MFGLGLQELIIIAAIMLVPIACGLLSGSIAKLKGAHYGLGFACGFFLGPIGVLIACFWPVPNRS